MAVDKNKIEVKYETLVVIWGALLFSQVTFLIIIYFVKPRLFSIDGNYPILGEKPLITIIFAIMAIAMLGLSVVLRRQHMERAARDRDAGCVQTGLVLGCALSEVCSILGVVLALAFDYPYFIVWNILGILGILFHFPRRGNYDAALFGERIA